MRLSIRIENHYHFPNFSKILVKPSQFQPFIFSGRPENFCSLSRSYFVPAIFLKRKRGVMENEVNEKSTAPFLLIQKPQELIRLFEGMIDQKIRELVPTNVPPVPVYSNGDSPFLSSKEVQKIFHVSRQTINDWRKSDLLQSFKIKSRRFFFKEQVEQLRTQLSEKRPDNM